MLVLSRKPGERLVINDNIVLTVVSAQKDGVKLAIAAPREIKIYRGEIYDAISAENQAAVAPQNLESLAALKEIQRSGGDGD